MILLELALQGIRGFPPLLRLSLRPGVNVGRVPDRERRRSLLDAVYHCLYPDPARAQATARLVDPGATEARIALTFFGRDKTTYRIVREAANGAVSLHRFEAGENKYSLLTRTSQEVAQYVRVQQQLPDEVSYERLFLYAPEAMPSLGGKARTRSGAPLASGQSGGFQPSGPGLPRAPSRVAEPRASSRVAPARMSSTLGRAPSALGGPLPTNALVQAERAAPPPEESAGDLERELEERRAELLRLKGELNQSSAAERAQAELDLLNARRFEISGRVERAKELRAEIQRLRQAAEIDADLRRLPAGFGDRLRHHSELESKYSSDRAKLAEERAQIESELGHMHVAPLTSDRYFLAGVVLAVLFLGLGLGLGRASLVLLNIPCVLVAVGAALRWVGDNERRARVGLRRGVLADREQRLERQYELDTGVIRRLMERQKIEAPSELLERIEGAEQVGKQLRVAEGALAGLLADPGVAEADRELPQLIARIEQCEALVVGATSVLSAETLNGRVVQLEREVEALERRLGKRRLESPSIADAGIPVVTGDLLRAGTAELRAQSLSWSQDLPRPTTSDITAAAPLPRAASVPPGTPVIAGAASEPPRPRADSGAGARVPRPRAGSVAELRVAPPRALSQPPAPARPRGPSVLGTATPPAPPARVPPARGGSVIVPPTEEAAALFDFGGGHIGSEDEEEGYGSGYGGGGGGADGGKKAGTEQGEVRWAPGAGGEPLLAMGTGGYGGGGAGDYGDEGAEELSPDRSRDVVQVAVDLLQLPVDTLAEKISPRLAQYLGAFTGGRLERARFGPKGELSVGPPGEDEEGFCPYVELAAADVDAVDLALRFALVEYSSMRFRIPILFDDPFLSHSPEQRRVYSQMLGYLGRLTQVVFLTEREDVSGHDCAPASIG